MRKIPVREGNKTKEITIMYRHGKFIVCDNHTEIVRTADWEKAEMTAKMRSKYTGKMINSEY